MKWYVSGGTIRKRRGKKLRKAEEEYRASFRGFDNGDYDDDNDNRNDNANNNSHL
jgi:hypothetical protein